MYGIDLELEFKDFVEDNGWWVTFRWFDLTKHSKYYDDNLKEAIGGPKWKYKDLIVKARRVERSISDAETFSNRTQFTMEYDVIYFIMSSLRPKKEDMIIEIPENMKYLGNAPKHVRAIELYDIQHVESKIDKKLCFSKCYCKRQIKDNDITLTGSIPVKLIR